MYVLVPTESVEGSFFQDPEKSDLIVETEFTDLVEKKRPSVRGLELSQARLGGARKSPLLTSEELGFNKVFQNCATVDSNEGTL